jgi:SAM-dependent methyltransferase
MTYGEKTVSQTISRLLSEQPGPDGPASRELDNLDQFHIGGADATDLLIGSLALGRDDRVLDVGSGFGGPARQTARRTGNHVVGIDITPAYVDAARDLSLRAGLGDLTEFRCHRGHGALGHDPGRRVAAGRRPPLRRLARVARLDRRRIRPAAY